MKTRNTGALLILVSVMLLAVPACSHFGLGSSPTATYKAFFTAQQKKDVPGVKKTLSKRSLAMLETAAKAQNKTVDESLKDGFNDPSYKTSSMPPTRNEKIDGDSATLEVQDQDSKMWETMYFVKEEGDWKLALDKTLEELFKNIGK